MLDGPPWQEACLPLILAVDIGTSSVRSALFDLAGRRRRETTAQFPYDVAYSDDGGATLSPSQLEECFLACLQETLQVYHQKLSGQGPVLAVGVSCYWHSLLGVSKEGEAGTPIFTWADSRSSEQARRLRTEFDEEEIHSRTGCLLRSSFWPAKLRWLKATQPSAWDQTHFWMSAAEWLQKRLCNSSTCSYAMATGTGLLDVHRLQWDAPLLKATGIATSRLNELSDAPARLSSEAKRLLPALENADWFPAIGDGAAGNLGSGAIEPGQAAVNFGTSAAIRTLRTGVPKAPFGLFCYRVDRERFLLGGAISNAGNLREWCLEQLQLPSERQALEAELAARHCPKHGLTVLPFWVDERAPWWEENRSGVVYGLRHSTSALDILQATEEASFFRLAEILEKILECGDAGISLDLIVSGGIRHSKSALRRLANVLGQRVLPCEDPEASLRGGAVFVVEKLGCKVAPASYQSALEPEPEIVQVYGEERKRYRDLDRRLSAQPFPRLTDVTR